MVCRWQGAKGVIISIIGGDDMKLLEVDEAANHIRELVDPNANIIWGSAFNPESRWQDPRLGRRNGYRTELVNMAEIALRARSRYPARCAVRPSPSAERGDFRKKHPRYDAAALREPEPVAEAEPLQPPEPEPAAAA